MMDNTRARCPLADGGNDKSIFIEHFLDFVRLGRLSQRQLK
jgi:hypothetical protein